MPDDIQEDLPARFAGLSTSQGEAEAQSVSTTRKRTKKSNPDVERPRKRVKIKEPASASANNGVDGQNAKGDAKATPKRRGRIPKAPLPGEQIVADIAAENLPEDSTAIVHLVKKEQLPEVGTTEGEASKKASKGDAKSMPKKRGRPPKASLPGEQIVADIAAKSLPENDSTATVQPVKEEQLPEVGTTEGEASKKVSPKKKAKGTQGKAKGPVVIPGPKWKLLKTFPIAATSTKDEKTTQRPRIWFGSSDELQSTLPELTGQKCINGLSSEFNETSILLFDEGNTAFQVTRDESDVRFIDLVTTRAFVQSIPEKQHEPMAVNGPSVVPASDTAVSHERQLPSSTTQAVTIPIPNQETTIASNHEPDPGVYLIKTETNLYRFNPEPDDIPMTNLWTDYSQDYYSPYKGYPGEPYESPSSSYVPMRINFRAPLPTFSALNHESYQPHDAQNQTWRGTYQAQMTTEPFVQRDRHIEPGRRMEFNRSSGSSIENSVPAATLGGSTHFEASQTQSTFINERMPSHDVHSRVELVPKIEQIEPMLIDICNGQGEKLAEMPGTIQTLNSSQAPKSTDPVVQQPTSTETLGPSQATTQVSETKNEAPEDHQKDQEVVPTPLPKDIQIIIDAYLSGTPLTLIASRSHLRDCWSLRLPKLFAYAMMGYFKIIGIQETLLESSVTQGDIDGQQSLSGQVRWLFRLQWRPGGEEFILPKMNRQMLEYPWWVQPPDTNQDIEKSGGDLSELELEPDTTLDATEPPPEPPTDPEDDFPTTARYRQARLANPEYEFRHDHYRLIYESLLPFSLLSPFGPFVLDTAFPQGWLCTHCGRVNYQVALRHRTCASLRCKDKPPMAEPYKVDLFAMRDPQDRLLITHPYDTWPKSIEPQVVKHRSGAQTITYSLDDEGTASVKHVFLGNFDELQAYATTLLDKIQIEVELKRPFNDSSPYFSYVAKAPETLQNPTEDPWPQVPDCINEAKTSIFSARFTFGLEDSHIAINRLTVLAWITIGAKKGPEILRAKDKCVVIIAFGYDVILTLTSRPTEPNSTSGKSSKINDEISNKAADDGAQSPDITDSGLSQQLEVPADTAPSKVTPPTKAGMSFVLYLVHGDCVVLDGNDFEYTIKRGGTSFLLIASYQKA